MLVSSVGNDGEDVGRRAPCMTSMRNKSHRHRRRREDYDSSGTTGHRDRSHRQVD